MGAISLRAAAFFQAHDYSCRPAGIHAGGAASHTCGGNSYSARSDHTAGTGTGTGTEADADLRSAGNRISGQVSPPATQGQFYVAPNGSDSNPGTQAAPWLTIAHAASVVGGGTTVHVASGTYTQPVWVRASGSQLARIVFISDTQWAAHVSVLGSSAGWRNSGNYIDVEGFDITPRSRHLASPMKGPTTSWSATASTTWRHS